MPTINEVREAARHEWDGAYADPFFAAWNGPKLDWPGYVRSVPGENSTELKDIERDRNWCWIRRSWMDGYDGEASVFKLAGPVKARTRPPLDGPEEEEFLPPPVPTQTFDPSCDQVTLIANSATSIGIIFEISNEPV